MTTTIPESINELFSCGILVQKDEGVKPSEQFEQKRMEYRAMLDDSETLRSVHEEYVSFAPDGMDVDAEVVLNALVLDDETSQLDKELCFRIALLLNRFDGKEPVSGIPEGFIPIEGSEIKQYLTEFPTSILYFWREECPPCDQVRTDLEELLDAGNIPDFVGRAAVYGPDSAQLINDQYDVAAAPTVLFTVDGRIDSRYVGAKPKSALRAEIEMIVERHDIA